MRTLATVALASVLVGAGAAAAIDLDQPRGGWRDSGLEEAQTDASAAYPKPPVDRGAQRYRTLITGRIAEAGKTRRPGIFIVNGNPMPLYTDERGVFVRPWAFGQGSNSVEVRTPDGRERKRLQFYEASTTRTPARLRIVCGWNDGKAEVDLHVITPDGQHAFWAHPILTNGSGLDVDSVDGGGPEIFSAAAPVPGTYLVYVNYWGNFDAAGYNFEAARRERDVITTTVSVIVNENTVHEKRQMWTVPLRRIGDTVFVAALRF